jgi:hypothetical protein
MPIKINRFKQGFTVVPIAEDDFIQLKAAGQLAAHTIYCINNRLYMRTTPSETLFIGVLERVAALPPSPKIDRLYLNITTNEIAVFNGTSWELTPASEFSLYQTAESEQFVAVFGGTAGEGGGGTGGGGGGTSDPSLDGRVSSLEVSIELIKSGVPFYLSVASASAVAAGAPVGIDAAGRAVPVTAGSAEEVMRYVGIAKTAASSVNTAIQVQTDGIFTPAVHPNFSPGLPVYLNYNTASLTQIDPTLNSQFFFSQEVGIAVSSRSLLLRRSNAVRLK